MLSGVVAARRRRYVMLNAHRDDLPAIRALLPGMGAPSVLQLADEGAIAVHAAVEADEVWTLLPALKEAGATSILVLPGGAAHPVRATLDAAIEVAAPIVADVRDRGDVALLEWTERFDGPAAGRLSRVRRPDRGRRRSRTTCSKLSGG